MNRCFLLIGFLLTITFVQAQDSTLFTWTVSSQKVGDKQYELRFTTAGANGWQLYAPNQVLGEVPTTELQLPDSSLQTSGYFKDTGVAKTVSSTIFEGVQVKIYEGPATWKQIIHIG